MITIKGLIRFRTEVEQWNNLIEENKNRLLEILDHAIILHHTLHKKIVKKLIKKGK